MGVGGGLAGGVSWGCCVTEVACQDPIPRRFARVPPKQRFRSALRRVGYGVVVRAYERWRVEDACLSLRYAFEFASSGLNPGHSPGSGSGLAGGPPFPRSRVRARRQFPVLDMPAPPNGRLRRRRRRKMTETRDGAWRCDEMGVTWTLFCGGGHVDGFMAFGGWVRRGRAEETRGEGTGASLRCFWATAVVVRRYCGLWNVERCLMLVFATTRI